MCKGAHNIDTLASLECLARVPREATLKADAEWTISQVDGIASGWTSVMAIVRRYTECKCATGLIVVLGDNMAFKKE